MNWWNFQRTYRLLASWRSGDANFWRGRTQLLLNFVHVCDIAASWRRSMRCMRWWFIFRNQEPLPGCKRYVVVQTRMPLVVPLHQVPKCHTRCLSARSHARSRSQYIYFSNASWSAGPSHSSITVGFLPRASSTEALAVLTPRDWVWVWVHSSGVKWLKLGLFDDSPHAGPSLIHEIDMEGDGLGVTTERNRQMSFWAGSLNTSKITVTVTATFQLGSSHYESLLHSRHIGNVTAIVFCEETAQ